MKIEPYQREFIKDLARAKIGGHSDEEVVWFLLQMAIRHMTETSYVQKFLETRNLLKGKK